MTPGRSSWFRRGQGGLLAECLIWAFIIGAFHAGIATIADAERFEPEVFDEYWYIVSHRWDFVPDYLVWIGLPLTIVVGVHARYAGRRRSLTRQGGDEYRIFDLDRGESRPSIETFVYLYLGAMIIAALGRTAIARCWMRGECDFSAWYQGLLYSTVFLIWPLILLLLRHVLWKAIRR